MNGETMGSPLRAAVLAISAYVRIMGAALGSIMASVMTLHIDATIAKLVRLQAPPINGLHKASYADAPDTISPSASQPSPASTITQITASTFGRAKAAPSREAAGCLLYTSDAAD